MAGKSAWVLLVGFLLVQRAATAQTTPWALEVVSFDSTARASIWVGLLNQSEEARLVCILTRGVSYEEKGGVLKGKTEGGSPHGCDVDDQFQLLRAGQTMFIRQPLPPRLADRISGPLRVELGVVDRPVLGSSRRREPVGVTWEGTLQEAADNGRALVGAAKRGK